MCDQVTEALTFDLHVLAARIKDKTRAQRCFCSSLSVSLLPKKVFLVIVNRTYIFRSDQYQCFSNLNSHTHTYSRRRGHMALTGSLKIDRNMPPVTDVNKAP